MDQKKNPIAETNVDSKIQNFVPAGWKMTSLIENYFIAWNPKDNQYQIFHFILDIPITLKNIQKNTFPFLNLTLNSQEQHKITRVGENLILDWNPTTKSFILYDVYFDQKSTIFTFNLLQSGLLEEADANCDFVPMDQDVIIYWKTDNQQFQRIQLVVRCLLQEGYVKTTKSLSQYKIYWLGKDRIMLYNPNTKESIHGNIQDILSRDFS
jgi:hypothetical protein